MVVAGYEKQDGLLTERERLIAEIDGDSALRGDGRRTVAGLQEGDSRGTAAPSPPVGDAEEVHGHGQYSQFDATSEQNQKKGHHNHKHSSK